jgi:putative ATPase
MDLFEEKTSGNKDKPLAVRLRPEALDEFVGQEHILGKDCILTRAIKSDRLSSLILYGPPGSGKTSLAWCISKITKSHFVWLNAATSCVEELRTQLTQAKHRKNTAGKKTILFIDEIHRFNKAQQDVLMPDVEEANVILIGATVYNPFFSIVSPLVSRSLVLELKPLKKENVLKILTSALKNKERGLGIKNKSKEEGFVFPG